MYEYKLIITMSDGRYFERVIGTKENRLLDDEKKCLIDRMFRSDYINFSDYIELYEDNEYVVLNTIQISSISICESLI